MSDLWWLSFCDDTAPAGSQFLGVCLVRAPDLLAAVAGSHALGINPGGQVVGYRVSEGVLEHLALGVLHRDGPGLREVGAGMHVDRSDRE